MPGDITCNVCGGTEFSKQAGFYYCNECQTQSQDVLEQIFDIPEETAVLRQTSSKRIRTEKKTEDQLTSWECYNYIVFGLVGELIELGANAKLKQTVRLLWFKYLKELEVITHTPNTPPKLSAVNSQMDAQIVYRRSIKKRKSSRTPSPSSASSDPTSMDSRTLRREKSKKRRTLMLAEYDEFSNTMQSEDLSLHNQSLTSLRTASDTSSKDKEKFLKYNKSAKKELLKIMTKSHLRSHCRDIDSILDCHNVSYRSVSSKYSHGVMVLSRKKLYALIYLGLLINKDNIQLGDLLRFIREGSLSYHNVRHFFPDEFSDKNLNIQSWNAGNTILSHYTMREVAAEMAKYLGVAKYIPRQNLVQLCQRYCTELNLPDEVMGYTANLMSRALPRMQFSAKSKLIPNYEGRIICMIMFVIKLMFGLDDVTETKFSEYAENINNLNNTTINKMFVWKDWMYYIKYRKLVLIQHHFPTCYLYNEEGVQNSDIIIDFLTQQNLKFENDELLTREAEIVKGILEKLNDRQTAPRDSLRFTSSLTPFRDHVETLLNSTMPDENGYLTDVLNVSFKNNTLRFLIEPLFYLEQLSEGSRIGIKHRGANSLEMIRIPNFKVKRECWRKQTKKTVVVRLSKNSESNNNKQNTLELSKSVHKLKTKEIVRNFEERHKGTYKKNLRKSLKAYEKQKQGASQNQHGSLPFKSHASQTQETSGSPTNIFQNLTSFHESEAIDAQSQPQTHCSQGTETSQSYIHYNPYDRYWLKSINVLNINKEEFQDFIATFPDSFKLLLNECARITEQQPKNLFEEFTDVEIYLSYVAEFTIRDKHRNKIVNDDLKRLINKAKKNW